MQLLCTDPELRERLKTSLTVAELIESGEGDAVVLSTADDRARQRALSQLARMADLGRATAAVAHELNNPMTALLANIDCLERAPELTGELAGIATEAANAARRIMGIARDIGRYASPVENLASVALHEALGTAVRLTEPYLEDIAVRKELQPTGAAVASEGRLCQVLVNLIVNAAQALEGRPDARITLSTGWSKQGVWVRVHDNGPGIPPELLDRAMEPFFTTKTTGTGIGLALCRRFLEEMGGSLRLENVDGLRATVTLMVAEPPQSRTRPTLVPDAALAEEPVLVVAPLEIARAIGRILTSYEVTVADTDEGLARLSRGEPYKLVLAPPAVALRLDPARRGRVVLMIDRLTTLPPELGRLPQLVLPLDPPSMRAMVADLLDQASGDGSGTQ